MKNTIKALFVIIAKITSTLIPLKRTSCNESSIRCEYDFFNVHYRNSWFGSDSAPCCNQHLYELLKSITETLDREGVDYYIFYGTLLGAIRHDGGFVPWDTDVDLCVMEVDRSKVRRILKKNISTRHPLIKVNDHWDMMNYSNTNTVHADIYYMSQSRDTIFLKGYESIQYPKKEIFPLQTVGLYDLNVKAPKDVTSIRAKYGDDFLTHAYRQYALFQRKTHSFYPAKRLSRSNDKREDQDA